MPCRTDSFGYSQIFSTCYVHCVLNLFTQSEALFALAAESVIDFIASFDHTNKLIDAEVAAERRSNLQNAFRELEAEEYMVGMFDDNEAKRALFAAMFIRDLSMKEHETGETVSQAFEACKSGGHVLPIMVQFLSDMFGWSDPLFVAWFPVISPHSVAHPSRAGFETVARGYANGISTSYVQTSGHKHMPRLLIFTADLKQDQAQPFTEDNPRPTVHHGHLKDIPTTVYFQGTQYFVTGGVVWLDPGGGHQSHVCAAITCGEEGSGYIVDSAASGSKGPITSRRQVNWWEARALRHHADANYPGYKAELRYAVYVRKDLCSAKHERDVMKKARSIVPKVMSRMSQLDGFQSSSSNSQTQVSRVRGASDGLIRHSLRSLTAGTRFKERATKMIRQTTAGSKSRKSAALKARIASWGV